MGIIFAILSSIGWGVSNVFAGLGLRNVKVLPGTALSVISSFLTVGLVTAIFQWKELVSLSWKGLLMFAAVGTLSFALGRVCNYIGIQRCGAARSTSLTATAPFFAAISAVIFLGERPNWLIISGTVMIMVGLYLTVSGGAGRSMNSTKPIAQQLNNPKTQ